MVADIKNLDYVAFGAMLRNRMNERGVTTKVVAEQLGVSSTFVSLVTLGKLRPPPNRLIQFMLLFEIGEAELPRIDPIKVLPATKAKKIFISYNHKDHEYLDRLMVHLKPLEKKGLIDTWVDTKLQAGDKWKSEIEMALKSARVGILLISADFLASDFIVDNELPPMLRAAEGNGTLIVPVILKSCRFTREKSLREFQSINSPDEPLCLMDENERELIYDMVAQRIEDTFEG